MPAKRKTRSQPFPLVVKTPEEIEALLAQHGVKPIADPKELRGDFWPEDESIDEFIATIRRWRREGTTGDAP
jgi:hypothetical protein